MNSNLLMPIVEGNHEAPVFIIPSAGSTPLALFQLARSLPSKRPVYSFMFAGMEDQRKPYGKVEDMAYEYVAEMMKVQDAGPYYISGHCFGGNVAHAMAIVLEAGGSKVGLLALLEVIPPLVDEVASGQKLNGPATQYSKETRAAIDGSFRQIEQQISQLPNKHQDHFSAVTRHYMGIGNTFRPVAIDAPIFQLRSTVYPASIYQDWKYFSRASYSEKLIPGDTYSMLTPPDVETTGATLDNTIFEFY